MLIVFENDSANVIEALIPFATFLNTQMSHLRGIGCLRAIATQGIAFFPINLHWKNDDPWNKLFGVLLHFARNGFAPIPFLFLLFSLCKQFSAWVRERRIFGTYGGWILIFSDIQFHPQYFRFAPQPVSQKIELLSTFFFNVRQCSSSLTRLIVVLEAKITRLEEYRWFFLSWITW